MSASVLSLLALLMKPSRLHPKIQPQKEQVLALKLYICVTQWSLPKNVSNKCFQGFSYSITAECLTVSFVCFILRQKNIKIKMLNFSLITIFILYVAATSKSSCSLVFCGKAVLRLGQSILNILVTEKLPKLGLSKEQSSRF